MERKGRERRGQQKEDASERRTAVSGSDLEIDLGKTHPKVPRRDKTGMRNCSMIASGNVLMFI